MVHHRQRLPFGLEAGDDCLGVHSRLDQLQRHASADRFGLFGDVDHPAAALAEAFEELVAADRQADGIVGRVVDHFQSDSGPGNAAPRAVQGIRLIVSGEGGVETGTQGGIAGAGVLEEGGAVARREGDGGLK